jgi:hypothetical protein
MAEADEIAIIMRSAAVNKAARNLRSMPSRLLGNYLVATGGVWSGN